jgi:glycosyltransferase involved in cell wall biosynthesis
VIETCVRAARAAAGPGVPILVLDDASTDRTGQILATMANDDAALHVLGGSRDALPAGWFGKPWACQRAAMEAVRRFPEVEWLLFVDADVVLQEHAPALAVGYAEANQLDLLSGFGRLVLVGFWEKVLQPAVAGLILADYDLERVANPPPGDPRPIANGQFLLFRKQAYQAIGGHEAVANNVLDDVGMATAIQKTGHKYHMTYMPGLFDCRMYTSLGEIWRGWTKNLFPGFRRNWGLVLATEVFIGGWVVGPWLCLALSPLLPWELGLWGLLSVVLMASVRIYLDRRFGQDSTSLPFMALGWSLLGLLILNSAIQTSRGQATWKGRILASPSPQHSSTSPAPPKG